MESKVDCTVIGDAIVDLVIPVDSFDQFNKALVGGILNADCTISPGGTANVAAGIATLGSTSAFVGKVGADCFGTFFIKDLKKTHVLPHVSVSKTRKTGLAIVLSSMSDNDRFFIVDRGANVELGPNDLDYNLAHGTKIVYFSGFSLQDPNVSKVVLSFIKEAALAGSTIVFNPGAHNIVATSGAAVIEAIQRYADIVILNHAEGQRISHGSTDEQIIDYLLELDVRTVALTKGGQGSVISTRSRVYRIKPPPCEKVDATGAGDAYAAGFIYGMIKGWELEKAGNFSTILAQAVVSQRGPRCDFSKIRAFG